MWWSRSSRGIFCVRLTGVDSRSDRGVGGVVTTGVRRSGRGRREVPVGSNPGEWADMCTENETRYNEWAGDGGGGRPVSVSLFHLWIRPPSPATREYLPVSSAVRVGRGQVPGVSHRMCPSPPPSLPPTPRSGETTDS